ncbi:reverse transcriptase N-terminal domain-containing protein [Mannheimia haemolytica]|nr:reverse transcriptase N-terminal domain-containing protein [Mannheimia haemolytica]
MKERKHYTEKLACNPATPHISKWHYVDWHKAETYERECKFGLRRQHWKVITVKNLQRMLTHSHYAKLVAVRRVTENQGKRTSGVDKELWETPETNGKPHYH